MAGSDNEAAILVLCGRIQVLFGGVGVFDRLDEMLILDFADDVHMATIFDALLAELRTPRPGSRAMATALVNESIVHVFRRLCAHPNCGLPWLDALDDPAMKPALEAMLETPGEPHTVATLATLCHMSRSAFARRFRERFGQPPSEYLRGIRLRRAARLLHGNRALAVSTIAGRVGFGSRSQFSRAFEATFHRSPTEFRA